MSAVDLIPAIPVASVTTLEATDPWVRISLDGGPTALATPTHDSPVGLQKTSCFSIR
jgi:hypothetical protein